MYLRISTYSEKRMLIKTMTRVYNTLKTIEKKVESLEIKTPYEGIVISLVDEDENYIKVIPGKDRIHYVDVGISPNLNFLPNDDQKFFSYIYEKVELVIEKSKIEKSDKEKIKDVLLAWKNSL
ncbi:hypothetical protein ACFLRT_05935 [Acidobacteriota bacterium]